MRRRAVIESVTVRLRRPITFLVFLLLTTMIVGAMLSAAYWDTLPDSR